MSARLFLRNDAGARGVPAKRSFQRWLDAIPALRRRTPEINVVVVGAREGRRLNRRFRDRDYATNVLSFPYQPLPGQRTALLGDIAICAPVVAREAKVQGKPVRDHFAHLTVHGVLHLLGFDHETDAEAARMEALERSILARLGIADPYAPREHRPGNP